MKMPRSGPWLAPGESSIGPKKPAENPIAPMTIDPLRAQEIDDIGSELARDFADNVPGADLVLFHTNQPAATA